MQSSFSIALAKLLETSEKFKRIKQIYRLSKYPAYVIVFFYCYLYCSTDQLKGKLDISHECEKRLDGEEKNDFSTKTSSDTLPYLHSSS